MSHRFLFVVLVSGVVSGCASTPAATSDGGGGAAPPVDGGTGGAGGSRGTGGAGVTTGTGGVTGTGGGADAGDAAPAPGGDAGADAADGPVTRVGWPSYDQAAASPLSTPVLIILTDFSDSDIASTLPNPEPAWSALMFGRNQGQANNYWYEISQGQFQLLKARETYGQADDGVVHVHLSAKKPTSGQFVVQEQPWIPEALDLAARYVRFADYDTDHDGHISNHELSILFPINLDFSNIAGGAGAEANIAINHAVAGGDGGAGVIIDKFLRVEDDYTSIGTPCHELGHHILGLKHAPPPTDQDLMGLGAYAQDPVITRLSVPDHYATRPTGLTGFNKIAAGFVKPTVISDTTKGVKLYSPQERGYNVIQLPVVDGFMYLENRTAEGYDRSIPFCAGHSGGLFVTEVSQYTSPLDVAGIFKHATDTVYDEPEQVFCDFYGLKGHNDTFTLGRYTISQISTPGSVMTVDITRNDAAPVIAKYQVRYWVNNPAKVGYRMWHIATVQSGKTLDVDFASFPSGNDPSGYFTMGLETVYNTGEVRSVNADATWTSASPYIVPVPLPFTNPGATRGDAIIVLAIATLLPRAPTVVLNVSHQSFSTSLRLLNVP